MPDRLLAPPPVHVRVVRFFERRPWLGDTLFKMLPLLMLSALFWTSGSSPGRMAVGTGMFGNTVIIPMMLLLELLAIVPLAFSRIRPGLAAGVIAFAALCQVLAMYGPGASAIAVPLAVYACAKYGTRPVSLSFLVMGVIGAALLGILVLASAQSFSADTAIQATDWGVVAFLAVLIAGFSAAVVVSAWLFGDLAGRRRREREAIEEKNLLLERERDQEARLAADAERMRIAREMHDVVSHSLGVMIAQADGGRYVLDQDPVRAGKAFETIGETGREALTELRRMLGVLREEGALKKRPAPRVGDLPRLVGDVRSSGLEVELNIAYHAVPALSDGIELALYRIVQEALTNTLKHGGPDARSHIWLGTDHRTSELALEVTDTGRGALAPNDGAGSGLVGMVERARLYGGTLTAEPTGAESQETGFSVQARFPLDRVRPRRSAPRS